MAVPVIIQADDLSVDNQTAGHKCVPDLLGEIAEGVKWVTVAGVQRASSEVDDRNGAEPVVLQLEDPVGMVEWARLSAQRHW